MSERRTKVSMDKIGAAPLVTTGAMLAGSRASWKTAWSAKTIDAISER